MRTCRDHGDKKGLQETAAPYYYELQICTVSIFPRCTTHPPVFPINPSTGLPQQHQGQQTDSKVLT
jgi:hypothetical protein